MRTRRGRLLDGPVRGRGGGLLGPVRGGCRRLGCRCALRRLSWAGWRWGLMCGPAMLRVDGEGTAYEQQRDGQQTDPHQCAAPARACTPGCTGSEKCTRPEANS